MREWVKGKKGFPANTMCKESPPCSGPRVCTPVLEHTLDQCNCMQARVLESSHIKQQVYPATAAVEDAPKLATLPEMRDAEAFDLRY